MLCFFRETDSRVDDDHRRIHSLGGRDNDLLLDLATHLAHGVAVHGLAVHVDRVTTPMHEHVGNGKVRDGGVHLWIRPSATDIVDDAGSTIDRFACHVGTHRVDADGHAGFHKADDDRQDAVHLGVDRHTCGSRARGFPSHIDNIGALVNEGQSVPNRQVGRREATPIREGIGRDIDNAPHHRHSRVQPGYRQRRHSYRALISAIASARVAAFNRVPRMALVTVIDPALRTPRTDMHVCSASTTTIAPRG